MDAITLSYVRVREFAREFFRNERGDAVQTILIVGMIAIPLLFLLIFFSDRIVEMVNEQSDELLEESQSLTDKAKEQKQ